MMIRFFTISLIAIIQLWVCQTIFAVQVSSTEWKVVCQQIANGKDSDLNLASDTIQVGLAGSNPTEPMYCAKMLLNAKTKDYDQVKKTVVEAKRNISSMSISTESLIARLRLQFVAIQDGKIESALESLIAELNKPEMTQEDRRLTVEMLGRFFANHEIHIPGASATTDSFNQARLQLLGRLDKVHRSYFVSAYQERATTAKVLNEMLDQIASEGLDGAKQQLEELKLELGELDKLVMDTTNELKEESKNNSAQKSQFKQQLAQLRRQQNEIKRQLNVPLPGHPGAPPVAPPMPSKKTIHPIKMVRVEFDIKRESNQSNCRRSGSSKHDTPYRASSSIATPKSRQEIEAEFQMLMNAYRLDTDRYNDRLRIYQSRLSDWQTANENRRNNISRQIAEIEDKIASVNNDLQERSESHLTVVSSASQHRKDLSQKQTEREILEVAIACSQTQSTKPIFQSSRLSMLDIDAETRVLAKRFD